MPGRKGQTNNPAGKKPGTKNYRERALIRNFSDAWLASLGEEGYIRWANKNRAAAIKIAVALAPKEVSGPDGKPLVDSQAVGRLFTAFLQRPEEPKE